MHIKNLTKIRLVLTASLAFICASTAAPQNNADFEGKWGNSVSVDEGDETGLFGVGVYMNGTYAK